MVSSMNSYPSFSSGNWDTFLRHSTRCKSYSKQATITSSCLFPHIHTMYIISSPLSILSRWVRGLTRRQLPIGPLCSKAKFVQAPANVCAHGQASTSLLGTPWSQAAAVATSVQRWSFSQRVQSISAATTLSPKGKSYRAAAGAFPFMGSQSRGVAVGGQSG